MLHGKGDKATVRGFHPSADDALARWLDRRAALGLKNGPLFCTPPFFVMSASHAAACSGVVSAEVTTS